MKPIIAFSASWYKGDRIHHNITKQNKLSRNKESQQYPSILMSQKKKKKEMQQVTNKR